MIYEYPRGLVIAKVIARPITSILFQLALQHRRDIVPEGVMLSFVADRSHQSLSTPTRRLS